MILQILNSSAREHVPKHNPCLSAYALKSEPIRLALMKNGQSSMMKARNQGCHRILDANRTDKSNGVLVLSLGWQRTGQALPIRHGFVLGLERSEQS